MPPTSIGVLQHTCSKAAGLQSQDHSLVIIVRAKRDAYGDKLVRHTRVGHVGLRYISTWRLITPKSLRTHPLFKTGPSSCIAITRMAALPPLSMSQTKDDLLKHLNMDAQTYSMMAVSCANRSTTPIPPCHSARLIKPKSLKV